MNNLQHLLGEFHDKDSRKNKFILELRIHIETLRIIQSFLPCRGVSGSIEGNGRGNFWTDNQWDNIVREFERR